MEQPSAEAVALIGSICSCPNIARAISDPEHPCRRVVHAQAEQDLAARQTPEPWSGALERAPVLFVSSNPSISRREMFPTGAWSGAEQVDFFSGRFDETQGRPAWIRGGTKTLFTDQTYSTAVMFLGSVRIRAEELLKRPATPGVDYCMTEVVHCKSPEEVGVPEAARTCSGLWLDRILALSVARVVVSLGVHAAAEFGRRIGGVPDGRVTEPLELAGRMRRVVFMPHPNARGPRRFSILDPSDLAALRAELAE